MDITRLIAVRHGETEWNKATRIQGQLDIALNATGRWQAAQAAAALADEPIAAVYASDLQRAAATAQAIAQPHGLAVRLHTDLRERHFGDMQGLTWQTIYEQHPEVAHAWRAREPDFAPAGGETLLALQARVAGVVQQLAAAHTGELIVLVAHGGILDMLYRLATGEALQTKREWDLSNAAINRLLWTPQGLQLLAWGDRRHLEDDALDESTA
jgi:probable phosphoglycerate mutase